MSDLYQYLEKKSISALLAKEISHFIELGFPLYVMGKDGKFRPKNVCVINKKLYIGKEESPGRPVNHLYVSLDENIIRIVPNPKGRGVRVRGYK